MLLMSSVLALLFLGGWLPIFSLFPFNLIPTPLWFSLKILFGVFLFIITRAALPRYRYDQLMALGWKCFLPLSVSYMIFTSSILLSFNLFV
jgi:NADH-quinone oxidoreductase subunit H